MQYGFQWEVYIVIWQHLETSTVINWGKTPTMVCDKTQGDGPRVVVSTAAFHARVWGSVPGLGGLKETKLFLPHPRVKVSIVGSLRDREVACSASDRQGSNFESCVWRTVSSQSSHHPQEVLLAQFSLYVHKGGLKPDSFCDKTQACGRFAPSDYQCCWINNLLDNHDLDSSSSSISGVPVGFKSHNRLTRRWSHMTRPTSEI